MLDNGKILEYARTFGQPVDPETKVPKVAEAVAEIDYADPSEHDAYFTVEDEVKQAITMDAAGRLVTVHVASHTETPLTFADVSTPEYYVKLAQLSANPEGVIARKRKTIARALNREESYRVIQVLDAMGEASSNVVNCTSGTDQFTYGNLLQMLAQIKDYGSVMKLITGTTVDNSIDAMEYNENKFHSIMDQMASLGIERVRVPFMVSRAAQDGATASFSAVPVCAPGRAYLVATDTEISRPVLFVRRRIKAIDLLGGDITVEGEDAPERITFVTPNPVVDGGVKFIGVGVSGYEQLAIVGRNQNAVSKFVCE